MRNTLLLALSVGVGKMILFSSVMPGKARIAELHVSAPEGSTVSPCVLTASPSHGDPARDPRRGASGEKGGKACPCTDPGPTCKGQSPRVTRAGHSPESFPAHLYHHPINHSRRGKGFHGLSPWGLVPLRGGRAEELGWQLPHQAGSSTPANVSQESLQAQSLSPAHSSSLGSI